MPSTREQRDRISRILGSLYDAETAAAVLPLLLRAVDSARRRIPREPARELDQHDCVLVAYPDIVRDTGKKPLQALLEFAEKYLAGVISTLHLLPFFPSSSDDGFSVIDYRSVDPNLGSWVDITRFGATFRLMFDAIFNHVSSRSGWFQGFLRDDRDFRDMFITVPATTDVSMVARPRSHPLLTLFTTSSGPKYVWTTFSADQVDLNYANPVVLVRIVETLLSYVERGAGLLRLDAIAYVWKEAGTRCINLPQVHHIVQLFRAILDAVAPGVALVTETNVPHEENISYFGDGKSEAQMVYNFPLAPLVLSAFQGANAVALSRWASGLSTPSPRTAFLNILASHDGIGVSPATGLIPDGGIALLVEETTRRGGLVSSRTGPGGTVIPYELNINYWDALLDPDVDEPPGLEIDRFLAAHAIMLAVRGVPALYFHSLFGSRGWREGPSRTGSARAINRQKCDLVELTAELGDAGSRRARVFAGMKKLLSARASSPCFHPRAAQRVLSTNDAVFAIARTAPADHRERVLCLQNVSGREQEVRVDVKEVFGVIPPVLRDIVSGREHRLPTEGTVRLLPYQVSWLRAVPGEGD